MLWLSGITSSVASDLAKVKISSDNILLFNTFLNKKPLIATLDAYVVDDTLMLAVDPLFDSLALRYIREKNSLQIWKDQESFDYKLSDQSSSGYWADDGFYLFIDEDTFSQLFDVSINYNIPSLKLEITTNNFHFPKQKLEELTYQRHMEQSSTSIDTKSIDGTKLLKDQYRLFTLPHGSFSLNTSVDKLGANNKKETSYNYSIQTVSDFLYHSTSLTATDYKAGEVTGRLNFSRYKSLPNELIAGAFDHYKLGDINSVSDNLTTSTQSGLGFIFTRAPEQYRTRNVGTTITEVARPGWDAELYRNGQFIELKKVPLDGNLVFEDVETQYGSNRYEIKLFGPFGEKEIRNQYLTLDKNALSKGEIAYSFYGLDDSHRLINNQGADSFTLNNSGASVSYGITDNWQVGLDYSSRENITELNERFFTLKNSLAFPGLLFNNEISIQEDKGYAQISSLSGNAFGQDTFNFIIESSDDYQSDRIHSAGIERQYADFSYSGSFSPLHYSFGVNYLNRDDNKSWQARSIMSRSFGSINFSNNIFYNKYSLDNNTATSLNGSLVAAGSLTDEIRMSAAVNYRPDQSDVIQSTSVTLAWHDSLNFHHNLRGVYNLQKSASKWKANYNLSWNSDKFQLQLATNYDAESNWSVGLGIRFFLGYDHHNQKIIFSNQLSSNSATLNSYSYLDRNPNGWRDEGDWDLAGVKFTGIPAWDNLASGKEGRAILPGVSTNTPFKFNAQWEYGTKAVANNFLLYTHPGAYIDVNIPFYVTTDFSGFIEKFDYSGQQSPLIGVLIELLDDNKNIINTTISDVDGYYQFSSVNPGNYQVKIADNYLDQSGYISDNVGFQLSTPKSGGFVELPLLILNKSNSNVAKTSRKVKKISKSDITIESNTWFEKDDINNGQIYSLPVAKSYQTQKQYFEPDSLINLPKIRSELPVKPITRQKLPIKPITRNELPIKLSLDNSSQPLPAKVQERDKAQYSIFNTAKITQPSNNLAITNVANTGFVIQLEASQSKNNLLTQVNKFVAPKVIYIADKEVNGEKWYCLLSHIFEDKTSAMRFMNTSASSGWAVSINSYTNMVVIN